MVMAIESDSIGLLKTAEMVARGTAAFSESQQVVLAEALVDHLLYGTDVSAALGLKTLGISPRQRVLMEHRDNALGVLFEFIKSQNPEWTVSEQLDLLVQVVKRRERSSRPPETEQERLADELHTACRALGRGISKRRAWELVSEVA